MNNNKNISLSNYSLTKQIIIINLLTVILGFIFLFIFNSYLINNDDLEKQYESIESDLIEVTNYLEKHAIINAAKFESCNISKLHQIVISKKCLERKEGGLLITKFAGFFLDPIISQNHLFNNYLHNPNLIKVYDDNLAEYANSLKKTTTQTLGVIEIYEEEPRKDNINLRYQILYFNLFNKIKKYFIQNKLKSIVNKNIYHSDASFVEETIEKKKKLFSIYKDEYENFFRINSNPIIKENTIYGVVLVSSQLDELNIDAASLSFYLTNFFIFIIFFIFFFSLLFSQSIVYPIKILSNIVRSERDKSKKILDQIPYPQRKDEIGILSEDIRSMFDDLKKRIDEIENFAADVSHELKNPLASLKSSSELLSNNKINENKKILLIQNMQKDIERINALISDISKYASTGREIEDELFYDFDLVDFLKKFLQSYSLNSKNINIKFEFDKTPSIIYANKDKLAQVLINLIDNSLSYSPRDSEILIQQKIINNRVIIYVYDQGEGISHDLSNKIFERFYTDRPSEQSSHTGLGLSIAKKIIESFSGSIKLINAQSQKYFGACFEINLPLKE